MPHVALAIVALASSHFFAAPDPASALVTAAASSTRPMECAARGQTGRAPSIWEKARAPQRAAYCRALAEAHARMETDPDGAAAAMSRAETAWPGRAATRIVKARLELAKGDTRGALAAFDEALKLEPRAVGDPATLRDHARALARGGRRAEALVAYRALSPQASLLPRAARAESLVEAALVVMSSIEPGLQEVVAIRVGEPLALLREARSLGATPIVGETALVFALALDRAGDAEAATRELGDAVRLGASLDRVRPLIAEPADEIALGALLAETSDRARAAAEWDRYAAAPASATWRGAAGKRRDALRTGGSSTQAKGAPPRLRTKGRP